MPNNDSYTKNTLALAPIFGAKAVLGDLPKASIEKLVELKAGGTKLNKAVFKRVLQGKGSGRMYGGALGIATAYPFIKGLQLANSKNKNDKIKGVGLMAGSTGAYQLLKSTPEKYLEFRKDFPKKPKSKGLKLGLKTGIGRSLIKIPGAVALGYSVSKARQDRKEGKPSYLPVAVGASSGALMRTVDGLVDAKKITRSSLRKIIIPKALGGAAGGAVGGLVLDKIVDLAENKLKKNK